MHENICVGPLCSKLFSIGISFGVLTGFVEEIGWMGYAIPRLRDAMGSLTGVLIAWMYVHTNSVLLAQLLHASSTGSLVVFGPPQITASEETLWYAVYACALWVVVACAGGTLTCEKFRRTG